MRLGQEVLSKIQNLLVRCDGKGQKKERKRFEVDSENKENNTFVKLYHDFKIQQKKKQQLQEQKIRNETREVSPFKITNKQTILINSQRQQPPIHERLQQLQHKKIEEMIRLREKYPHKAQSIEEIQEEEALELEMMERRRKEKKYSEQEAFEKVEELLEKDKMRIQRLNMLKLKVIQDHSKDFRCKPYVGKGSDVLWNRYKMKKQLSSSVFERFEQYEMQRKSHLQRTQKKVRQQVTPFAPKISSNSRLLASRSSSKTNLHQGLSRSCSCKCFQKTRQKQQNTSTLHSSRRR